MIRGSGVACGTGVEKSYFDIVKDRFDSIHFDLIRIAKFKDTSFDIIRTYSSDIKRIKPDIVFVHIGLEDAFFPVYRSEFKENLVQFVRLCVNDAIQNICLMTSHPLNDIYEMETMEIYNRTVREVALDLQCKLLPVHLIWYGFMDENKIRLSDLLLLDSRYPNQKGHELFADIIINEINKIQEKPK